MLGSIRITAVVNRTWPSAPDAQHSTTPWSSSNNTASSRLDSSRTGASSLTKDVAAPSTSFRRRHARTGSVALQSSDDASLPKLPSAGANTVSIPSPPPRASSESSLMDHHAASYAAQQFHHPFAPVHRHGGIHVAESGGEFTVEPSSNAQSPTGMATGHGTSASSPVSSPVSSPTAASQPILC
ncbi:hypothetical protein NFJ02_02g71440 [Pycnococcus provasolii]